MRNVAKTVEVRRVRKIAERYEKARVERKAAILSAIESGIPADEIAEASGLTRSAIYKIVSRSSERGSGRVPVGG